MELEKEKSSMESQVAQADATRPVLRATWLSEEQVRDAEAATTRALGRSLLSCVIEAEKTDTVQRPMEHDKAVTYWISHLRDKLKRYPQTLQKNKNRIEAFFRSAPAVKYAHDVTPRNIDAWVFRSGVQTGTQVSDAAVVRAFFNFAAERGWVGKSPFRINMADLAGGVRRKERPRILSVEQCEKLLAVVWFQEPRLIPYLMLSTWAFLRNAEACRATWDDVKLDGKANVAVWPRKRGTPSYRRVPLPACAVAWLTFARAEGFWAKDKPVWWERCAWDRVRERAGLLDRKARSWQDHILRHTGISYRYQETGDITLVTREAGNSSDTAFAHYLDLPEDGSAERFFGMLPKSAWPRAISSFRSNGINSR